MFRGLYIAGTAMMGNTTSIEVVSNNLSNANTASYKKDFTTQESFNDVLISKINGQSMKNNSPTSPVKSEVIGNSYTLNTTGGYFKVRNDEGLSYNSTIKFNVNEDGYLSTYYLNDTRVPTKGQGNMVQGYKGDVYVGDEAFTIDEAGQVIAGGQVIDKLLFTPSANVIGTMNSGVRISQITTDFEQGALERTENDLDFALEGSGFFELETPSGTRYTRNGSFKINSDMELVTTEGYKVMGIDGPIVLTGEQIVVNKFGEIAENEVIIDKFKIVNPVNTQDMKKIGESLYLTINPVEDQPFDGDIIQGFLEGSNVNSVMEMVGMLTLYRTYEANQRVISSYDRSIEKLLTDLGR